MDDGVKKWIDDTLNITHETEYHFRKLYGLTFVFRKEFLTLEDMLTSAEVKCVGIIYRENGQYYFAPLCEVDDLDGIIREFVGTIPEEECFHSQP